MGFSESILQSISSWFLCLFERTMLSLLPREGRSHHEIDLALDRRNYFDECPRRSDHGIDGNLSIECGKLSSMTKRKPLMSCMVVDVR